MTTATIPVGELPAYLLKPLPKSRVNKHMGTLAFVQLTTDAGFLYELAVCENVWAARRFSTSDGKWSKWADAREDSFDAAWEKVKSEVSKLAARGYRSVVSQPLLLPVNETDLRHLRAEPVLPRHSLEYGTELLDSIREYIRTEHDKARALLAGSGVTMPPSSSTPPVPPPPGTPMSDIFKEMDAMGDEIEAAVKDHGALGSVADAGF